MALLYGRTGRLTVQTGGFRPGQWAAVGAGQIQPASATGQYIAGMLTQGGQGGHPVPLAWRYHGTLTRFLLHLHEIEWKSLTDGPPG
jgi:hypothetical protein